MLADAYVVTALCWELVYGSLDKPLWILSTGWVAGYPMAAKGVILHQSSDADLASEPAFDVMHSIWDPARPLLATLHTKTFSGLLFNYENAPSSAIVCLV